MKPVKFLLPILITLVCFSCDKSTSIQKHLPIPNGDFEFWNTDPTLYMWQTNSCPFCEPAYETYIVKKVTDATSGLFAARFIFNNVYKSFAFNKFFVSQHPTLLTADLKSNITNGDTATIHIDLYSGNTIVDSGNWDETSSSTTYKKISIPISQNAHSVDSALITITGGKFQNTELFVDNLVLR